MILIAYLCILWASTNSGKRTTPIIDSFLNFHRRLHQNGIGILCKQKLLSLNQETSSNYKSNLSCETILLNDENHDILYFTDTGHTCTTLCLSFMADGKKDYFLIDEKTHSWMHLFPFEAQIKSPTILILHFKTPINC